MNPEDRFVEYRNIVTPYFTKEGFRPFSFLFDWNKVDNHLQALGNHGDSSARDTLKEFRKLHEIHLKLVKKIETIVLHLKTNKVKFIQTMIALVNEQYVLNGNALSEMDMGDSPSVFDFSNITVAPHREGDNNPQPLQSKQESVIELLTIIVSHVYYREKSLFNGDEEMEDDDRIQPYEEILMLVNEYYNVQNHVEQMLCCGGTIELYDDIMSFCGGDTNLDLAQGMTSTIMQNRTMVKYFSFQNSIMNHNFAYIGNYKRRRIIDKVIEEKGKFKFELREKTPEEYHHLFQYDITIQDYNPHLREQPLDELDGLSLMDLIHLQESISLLISEVLKVIQAKEAQQSAESVRQIYAPRISKKLIIEYLTQISEFEAGTISKYLDLLENNGKESFYSKPFLPIDDYYLFPILPLVGYNPYYLMDEWLQALGYKLDVKGPEFEQFVRDRLKMAESNEYNDFKVVDYKKIYAGSEKDNNYEEIDLILELRDRLIIGEIKRIKYVMSERNCFLNLVEQIEFASEQLIRKETFLRDNRIAILEKYGFDSQKSITKVIVVNYPFYNGCTVKDIPVIDFNSLLPYFNSDRAVLRAMDDAHMEVLSEEIYYDSIDVFNENVEKFLRKPSDLAHFEGQVEHKQLDYYLPNLGVRVFFDDYRVK